MKRMITITFAAATLLVGGIAVAHDSKDAKDGKASCPMHASAEAKSEKAEGDCCKKGAAKTAAAETAKPEGQAADTGKHCDMKAEKSEHAAHEGHAGHEAHQAKDAKHGECDMKAAAGKDAKDGKSCCADHAKSETATDKKS